MIPSLPTSFLKNSIYGDWKVGKSNGCSVCGCDDALKVRHALKPDFVVPDLLRDRMSSAETAFCLLCGHLYRCDSYTRKEIDDIFAILGNKDDTTKGDYMVRDNAGLTDIKIKLYAEKEYLKWKTRLSRLSFKDGAKGKNILVIRPSSIGCLKAFEEAFPGAVIFWKDYSRSAEMEIRDTGRFRELSQGFVRSYFNFNCASSKFDMIIINHCLQHSVSLNDDIEKAKSLLSLGGSVLFANEVNRKLHNPFHMNHFSEAGLRDFLVRHLDKVTPVENGIDLDIFKKGLFENAINKDVLTGSAIVVKYDS